MAKRSVGDPSAIINHNAVQVSLVTEAELNRGLNRGGTRLYLLGISGCKRLPSGLTEQERQCLALLSQDLTANDIASDLNITERVVHKHLASLRKKFACNTNARLAIHAYQAGLTPTQ